MKVLLTLAVALAVGMSGLHAQSIVGKWQLTSRSTCLDDDMETTEEEDELVSEMESRQSGTASVIEFKENKTGSENLRIMDKRKSTRTSSFLYKVDGEVLYLLDKKSRLLKGTFDIEKLSGDSLVFSNAARACETWILVRIQ